MDTVYKSSKFYQDHCDPTVYLSLLYSQLSTDNPEGNPICGQVVLMHELMRTGKIKGKDLLDVGCGPSILFSIVPSQYFENVYLSDYLERNVKTIQTWLDDRPEQVDYQPFFEFAGKYVDKGASHPESLRKKIRGVFQCNVHLPGVLPPGVKPTTFDCVINSLMLPAACSNDEELKKAVSHMASLLNPGGTMISYVALESNFVIIGKHTYRNLYITEKSLSYAFWEAGMRIIGSHCEDCTMDKSVSDAKYICVYITKKPN